MKYWIARETDDGDQPPVLRMVFDTLEEAKNHLEKRVGEWAMAGYEIHYELFGFHVVARDGTTIRYAMDFAEMRKESEE